MSNKKDIEREKHIRLANDMAQYNRLALVLGADRQAIEDRQQRVEGYSQEAVNDIMKDVNEVGPDTEVPEEIRQEMKMTIETILKAKMPTIIAGSMERLRAKDILRTSMLDGAILGYTKDSEIKKFLENLGVDLDNQKDLHYAKRVFAEALFRLSEILLNEKVEAHREVIPTLHRSGVEKIRKWRQETKGVQYSEGVFDEPNHSLLDKEKSEQEFIEKELARVIKKEDIINFFKISSGEGPNQKGLGKQACALLRIAYAIDYMERDPQISILKEALEVLMDKKDKHFITKRVGGARVCKYRTEGGNLPMTVERLEIRTKERSRIITKLLHKPGNRSGKVLDHIGVRVTTKSAIDTLKLIYYMFFNVETQMFPFMSIRIDETKNLILDANMIEEILDDDVRAQELVNSLSKETIDHAELSDVLATDACDDSNRFSAPKYRSIHIIVDLPLNSQKYGRLSFPIEVQILDTASMVVNEHEAPHASYTGRQTAAVLERIVHQNNIETVLDIKTMSRKRMATLSRKSLRPILPKTP